MSDCNAIVSYAKNPDPYNDKSCCPNMKRVAKKWAKLKHKGKTWLCKTCCNACVNRIQKSLNNEDDRLYTIKGNILMKWNKKEYKPVFKLQTPQQVKKKDPNAQYRN